MTTRKSPKESASRVVVSIKFDTTQCASTAMQSIETFFSQSSVLLKNYSMKNLLISFSSVKQGKWLKGINNKTVRRCCPARVKGFSAWLGSWLWGVSSVSDSLLISLSITLRTSKFRNQFTISSKYFDMACFYLKWKTYSGPISFEV